MKRGFRVGGPQSGYHPRQQRKRQHRHDDVLVDVLNHELSLCEVLVAALWVSKHKCGVPPFGHTTQLRVFVDPDLLQYDEVWAAAGTWNDNFGANPIDIVRVAGGVVTDLKRD